MHDLERVIARFTPEIAPNLAGRLYRLDERNNLMVERCSWLSPDHSRHEFPPMACWALQRGDLHRPAGHSIDISCDHINSQAGSPVDSICLPLMAQRITLGLLYFEVIGSGSDGPSELAESYLKILAENIGLALGNLRLRDALREMAMADPLTGLANRRQLERALEIQMAEADSLGHPMSCVMLDVDHFKHFNDQFGHDAGDMVLREMGELLRNSTREHELAFRFGGEEFLLLMPGLNSGQAALRAEEIRRRIGSLHLTAQWAGNRSNHRLSRRCERARTLHLWQDRADGRCSSSPCQGGWA